MHGYDPADYAGPQMAAALGGCRAAGHLRQRAGRQAERTDVLRAPRRWRPSAARPGDLALDLHRDDYEEIAPPHLVRTEVISRTGHLTKVRHPGLPGTRRRPLAGAHRRSAADGSASGRDPPRVGTAPALHGVYGVLASGGRGSREGHPRHATAPRVPQGRVGQAVPARGRRGRARPACWRTPSRPSRCWNSRTGWWSCAPAI